MGAGPPPLHSVPAGRPGRLWHLFAARTPATDDAIVMVEHIVHRMRSAADDREAGIMRSAFEFTRSLAGSSASTIVIVLPLAFLTGLTGAFFKALSITMPCALIVSFLVLFDTLPVSVQGWRPGRRAVQS